MSGASIPANNLNLWDIASITILPIEYLSRARTTGGRIRGTPQDDPASAVGHTNEEMQQPECQVPLSGLITRFWPLSTATGKLSSYDFDDILIDQFRPRSRQYRWCEVETGAWRPAGATPTTLRCPTNRLTWACTGERPLWCM